MGKDLKYLKQNDISLKYLRKLQELGKETNVKRVRKVYEIEEKTAPEKVMRFLDDLKDELNIDFGSYSVISPEFVKSGSRTMRIGKWLKKLFTDKTQQNILLNRYSEFLNNLPRGKNTLIISNKIIDCLMSSNRTEWGGSCQSLGADRWGANPIYFLSPGTYVAYILDSSGDKIWRNWIHTNDVDWVMFGRQYPQPKEYMTIVRQHFCNDILKWKTWKHKVLSSEERQEKIQFRNFESLDDLEYPYGDVVYARAEICHTREEESDNELYTVNLSRKTLCRDCLNVVHPEHSSADGFCEDCREINDFSCDDCGGSMPSEDYFNSNGEAICESCYENNYSQCDHCDETMHNDDTHSARDNHNSTIYICPSCYDDHFSECSECGNAYQNLIELDSGREICQSCFEDDGFVCDKCCGNFLIRDLNQVDDGNYCNECSGEIKEEEETENENESINGVSAS